MVSVGQMLDPSCSDHKMEPCGRRAGWQDPSQNLAHPGAALCSHKPPLVLSSPYCEHLKIVALDENLHIQMLRWQNKVTGTLHSRGCFFVLFCSFNNLLLQKKELLFLIVHSNKFTVCEQQGSQAAGAGDPCPSQQSYPGEMTVKLWKPWKLDAGLISTIWLETIHINHPYSLISCKGILIAATLVYPS